MFYIIKKGSGDWWHRYNGNAKETNMSEWQIILELIGQTVSLQLKNGSNIPANAVPILEVIVIDETDASVEETFSDVEALRTRLIALGYNPYITADGGATYIEAGTNVTVTGSGTLADPYVINSTGGGGSQDLQSVVTEGNSFTKTVGDYTYTYEVFGAGGYKVNVKNNVTNDQFYQLITDSSIVLSSKEGSDNGQFNLGDGAEPSVATYKNGSNVFSVPFRTASGVANFRPANDRADGDYTLADDVDLALKADLNGSTSEDFEVQTTPAGANSAISKNYLDNLLTGITWKQSVKCSTTANHSLSGTSNVDGVTVPAGTRVLVRFQTASQDNGIYITAAGSWTRSTDCDTATEVEASTVLVGFGTLYKNTQWTQANVITTLGTDPVSYVQISGAGTYTASTGLSLVANVFSIVASSFGAFITSLTAKNTLVDADTVVSGDSAASGDAKKTTWLNVWTNYLLAKVEAVADAKVQNSLTPSTTVAPSATAVNNALAGYKRIIAQSGTPSSALTGTTAETQMAQITLPIGTYTTTDLVKIRIQLNKTTANSTCTWRIKISTSATMPSGNTDRVATFTDGTGIRTQTMKRTFWQHSGNLNGVDFTTSNANDDTTITSTGLSSQAFNNSTTQYYLYISAQLTNASDSVTLQNYEIIN